MKFTKMQAAGNDFILVENSSAKINLNNLARTMCNRHFGIGADGLITIDTSCMPHNMRIFNADGSEAEVCGNGLRCFTKYVYDKGYIRDTLIHINTSSGIKESIIEILDGAVNKVKVNMGLPRFTANEIPVNLIYGKSSVEINHADAIIDYQLNVRDNNLLLTFVNMGNPHSVCFITSSISEYRLEKVGPAVENHIIFPAKTNFEIARIIDKQNIEARVWERGVGETLACGSGACAIAVSAILKGLIEKQVYIIMPGGRLSVEWNIGGNVYLSGPVEIVFTGEWPE